MSEIRLPRREEKFWGASNKKIETFSFKIYNASLSLSLSLSLFRYIKGLRFFGRSKWRCFVIMYRLSIKSLYNFKNLLQREMKRQIDRNYYKMRRVYSSFFPLVARSTSRRYLISYKIDAFLRWSSTLPFIEHCLHKFLVPCTNWWTWRWISSILSSEASLSLQIRLGFNKPWYALCLFLRSSHFVSGSFNSILFVNT